MKTMMMNNLAAVAVTVAATVTAAVDAAVAAAVGDNRLPIITLEKEDVVTHPPYHKHNNKYNT